MSGIKLSPASFDFNNGKIGQIILQMQSDDNYTYSTFLNNMEQWATKVHPDELNKTTIYSKDAGIIYSNLCKEFATVTPQPGQ